MARSNFGGTANDLVLRPYRFGQRNLLSLAADGESTVWTFWTAATGGTQYTDLLDAGGLAVTTIVTVGSQWPSFQGPDGITAMWAEDGDPSTPRQRIEARDLAAVASAVVTAQTARDDAAASASAAAASVSSTVKVTAQTLTSGQQTQARTNIGAQVAPTGSAAALTVPFSDSSSSFRWGTVDEIVAAALGWVIAKGTGIDPTGVSDSAAALQAKIDAAAATGTTCWIPAGTYLITVPLQVKTNVSIMGAGQSTQIVKNSNTADSRGVNAVVVGYLLNNFSISRLRLIGNRTNYASGNTVTTNGLWLEQCSYFGVSDIRASDCAIGFKSKTCWTCSYVRCTGMRIQGFAFSLTDSCTSHFMQNCTAWGAGGGFELILCYYTTIIDSANDHCSAGGRSDDPFLPEGSGGSYTSAGYAFYCNAATVSIINAGLENGYCQYLYAKDSNVTMINPSISNINCYTPAFDLIGLKGSTSKARVRIINGTGFDTAVNQLTTSSFRCGLRVENADIQFINVDTPLNFHSSWGAFAYQGGSTTPISISGARTAAPTTGTWVVGDRVENSAPSAGGYMGWVCVTGGTPGTWKGYGAIQT